MQRDVGLRRATTVSIGVAGVSLAGVVAVAALARHDTNAGTQNPTSTTSDSDATSNTGTSSTDSGSGTFPNLGHGFGGGGAATSGGS